MGWSSHPPPIAGVLSAGGLPDLAQAKTEATEACGVDTIDRLTGPATVSHPDVYVDTSPPKMLRFGRATMQILVAGQEDAIAPPRFSAAYADGWRVGDHGSFTAIANTGHFELITPTTDARTQQVSSIDIMLGREPHPRPR